MATETDTGTIESLLTEDELYEPSEEVLKKAKIKDWDAEIKKGEKDLAGFWENAANELEWYKKWNKVLDDSNKPFYKWFTGAKCNIVHNALDRHIKTDKQDRVAIIAENEKGIVRKITYRELYREVNQFANGLKSIGIKKGDRVAIYMPNIPEIAVAMLGCAKIGAVHSVVYAGFSTEALRGRIEDAEAKVVITANGSVRNNKTIILKTVVDEAVRKCSCVKKVVIVKNIEEEKGRKIKFNPIDVWYHDLIKDQDDECETEVLDSEDILFILYTSGTTGKPKGVVHVHGGYAVGVNRTLKWVFDLSDDREDIFWCTADPGWITGHSYIIYGPLMAGTTTVMYDGVPFHSQPDGIWEVAEKHDVTIFYTAPTLIRMLMKFGEEYPKKHKLEMLRLLGTVGEPINPGAWRWYYKFVGKEKCPIMDTWWQTETGMFMITPIPISPLKAGSATKPFPGIQADIVDAKGNPVPDGKGGFLVIKTPWPAMLRTVYKDPKRYLKTYWSRFPGYYSPEDLARKDKDGYFWIQGRSDDVLKIAGHRIGTAEIESALVSHKAVAEAGVIGIPDEIRGEVAKAFVILKTGITGSDELAVELKKHVRHEIGPIVIIAAIEFVEKLPKTRSGKIMRRVLKAKELGMEPGDLSTLED